MRALLFLAGVLTGAAGVVGVLLWVAWQKVKDDSSWGE